MRGGGLGGAGEPAQLSGEATTEEEQLGGTAQAGEERGQLEGMDGPESHSEKNIPAQIQIQKCDISLESATLGRQRCWGALVAGLTECADRDRVYM